MIKYLLTIIIFWLAVGIVNGQDIFPPEEAGWKPLKIYDTVRANILIGDGGEWDVSIVQGYVVRQKHTYYGGIDPYYSLGYSQPDDEFLSTDIFFFENRKGRINPSIVWMHKVVSK